MRGWRRLSCFAPGHVELDCVSRLRRHVDPLQAWGRAADLAVAYSIGATEARAAHCLLKQVPPAVVQKLCALVKPGLGNDVVACLSAGAVSKLVLALSPVSVCVSARRFTMAKFVTHESIAAGYFNSDYVGSATAVSATWADILVNNEAVLELLVERLERDYLAMPPKSRRPWNPRDLDRARRGFVSACK